MSLPVRNCRIVSVGKRRDGGTKYWCLEHKADATAKYGRPAKNCRYAAVPPVLDSETLRLEISSYAGGVALWGAVPPVYDTTSLGIDRGIHVHARSQRIGGKDIDDTFRAVEVVYGEEYGDVVRISELDAIYFMVSAVFGFETKWIACSRCSHPHLDRDWFCIHPHQSHLCAACGRTFRDSEAAIGNPISRVAELLNAPAKKMKSAGRSLELRQEDFPGGIRIWGSNPAILWTTDTDPEEGIHVHAYREYGDRPEIDNTYSHVAIDGVVLDPLQVRTLMAQRALPHLAGRIQVLRCERCGHQEFDQAQEAYTPQVRSECSRCSGPVRTTGRLRKLVANPLLSVLEALAVNAPRLPQVHDLRLIPETL